MRDPDPASHQPTGSIERAVPSLRRKRLHEGKYGCRAHRSHDDLGKRTHQRGVSVAAGPDVSVAEEAGLPALPILFLRVEERGRLD